MAVTPKIPGVAEGKGAGVTLDETAVTKASADAPPHQASERLPL